MEGVARILRLWLPAVAVAAGLSLTACATTSPASDSPTVEASEAEPVDTPWEDNGSIDDSRSDDELVTEEPAELRWVCSYSPTYDYDWHNDIVCTNGTQQQRPYLREWDSYITESEIMESAREYERQLNGE